MYFCNKEYTTPQIKKLDKKKQYNVNVPLWHSDLGRLAKCFNKPLSTCGFILFYFWNSSFPLCCTCKSVQNKPQSIHTNCPISILQSIHQVVLSGSDSLTNKKILTVFIILYLHKKKKMTKKFKTIWDGWIFPAVILPAVGSIRLRNKPYPSPGITACD